MLTNTYACVAFLKARTGQDIFNVAKLRRRNQTDHQLVQGGVHVRGLQMRRSYRGSPTLIHYKDVSYKQERINHAKATTTLNLSFARFIDNSSTSYIQKYKKKMNK